LCHFHGFHLPLLVSKDHEPHEGRPKGSKRTNPNRSLPENKPLPWPEGLPCVRLERNTADTASAVSLASLAHGRSAGHRGIPSGHTADYWPWGKANMAHGTPSAHGRYTRRHTANYLHGTLLRAGLSSLFGFPPECWRQNTTVGPRVCHVYKHGSVISHAILPLL
jgi:hypothetical protein